MLGAVSPGAVGREFLLGLMARDSCPHGVRQNGAAGVLTLCTLIIDQQENLAVLASAGGTLVTVPVGDLAAGDPSRATVKGH